MKEITSLDEAELRLAYDCAADVYSSYRNKLTFQRGMTLEQQLLRDLAGIVSETIDCIENDQIINRNAFTSIFCYAFAESESPLLKVGFSVTVLLQFLLKDRISGRSLDTPRIRNRKGKQKNDVPTSREAESRTPLNAHPSPPQASSSRAAAPRDIPFFDSEPSPAFGNGMASGEVKEEHVEIKEEPIDDYEEVKMEPDELVEVKEEPLVDRYCPSTGDSRPLDQRSGANNGDAVGRVSVRDFIHVRNDTSKDFIPSASRPRFVIPSTSSGATAQPAVRHLVKKMRTDYQTVATLPKPLPTSKFQQKRPISTNSMDDKPYGLPNTKICHMCGELTEKFVALPFPLVQRNAFLQKIIVQTESDRSQLVKLALHPYPAYVCRKHVADMAIAIPPKVQFQPMKRYPKCDFCTNPMQPCRYSPADLNAAKIFFDGLVEPTPEQRDKIEFFLKTPNTRATICMHHVRPELKKIPDRTEKVNLIECAKKVVELHQAGEAPEKTTAVNTGNPDTGDQQRRTVRIVARRSEDPDEDDDHTYETRSVKKVIYTSNPPTGPRPRGRPPKRKSSEEPGPSGSR